MFYIDVFCAKQLTNGENQIQYLNYDRKSF